MLLRKRRYSINVSQSGEGSRRGQSGEGKRSNPSEASKRSEFAFKKQRLHGLPLSQLQQFCDTLLEQLMLQNKETQTVAMIDQVSAQLSPPKTLGAIRDVILVFHPFLDRKSVFRLFQVCHDWQAANEQPILWRNLRVPGDLHSGNSRQTTSEMPIAYLRNHLERFKQLEKMTLSRVTQQITRWKYSIKAPFPKLKSLMVVAQTGAMLMGWLSFIRDIAETLEDLGITVKHPGTFKVPKWWSTIHFPRLAYCGYEERAVLPLPRFAPALQMIEVNAYGGGTVWSNVNNQSLEQLYPVLQYLSIRSYSSNFIWNTVQRFTRPLKLLSVSRLLGVWDVLAGLGRCNCGSLCLKLDLDQTLMEEEIDLIRATHFTNSIVKHLHIYINSEVHQVLRELLRAFVLEWLPQLEKLSLYSTDLFALNEWNATKLVRFCKRLRTSRINSNLVDLQVRYSGQELSFLELVTATL